MKNLLTSFRIVFVTLAVCCIGYPLLVLGFARITAPESADGSLLRNARGELVGSRQVAQAFSKPRYFWPRPSAVDYDGAGAGGSNLSPASEAVAERAREIIGRLGASKDRPIPADLVTASGSGLDPHISLAAADYQVARVAEARDLPEDQVREAVRKAASPAGGLFAPDGIVNVLELNLALDRMTTQP